jgi:hypothetical protein
MALGKSTENLVKRVFFAIKDDWTWEKQSRAAYKIQRLARCFLAKNLLARKKRQEAQVKEMAFLMAGKNTERLQRKFIALMLQGVMDKAAAKFQSIFRGKKGRNAAKAEQERNRRVRALARRCMGGAGHLAIDGWKAYIVLVRAEKNKAATKLQGRYRIKLAQRGVDFERKERNRKEVSAAQGIGGGAGARHRGGGERKASGAGGRNASGGGERKLGASVCGGNRLAQRAQKKEYPPSAELARSKKACPSPAGTGSLKEGASFSATSVLLLQQTTGRFARNLLRFFAPSPTQSIYRTGAHRASPGQELGPAPEGHYQGVQGAG